MFARALLKQPLPVYFPPPPPPCRPSVIRGTAAAGRETAQRDGWWRGSTDSTAAPGERGVGVRVWAWEWEHTLQTQTRTAGSKTVAGQIKPPPRSARLFQHYR